VIIIWRHRYSFFKKKKICCDKSISKLNIFCTELLTNCIVYNKLVKAAFILVHILQTKYWYRLFWLQDFVIFFSPYKQMLEQYFQLYKSCFLPHPLKSIIWNHPSYLSMHTVQALVYFIIQNFIKHLTYDTSI